MPLSNNLRGILLMAIGMATFSINDAAAKYLTTQMNVGQLMMLRGLIAGVLIGALALHQGALRPVRTLLVGPVWLRVIGEIGGSGLFLAAIALLPLGNVMAIIQSLPLVMTLAAVLLLGEPVGWRRWMAIAAGFVGVLIIVRPGAASFDQYTLLALLSVAFYSMRELVTKRIPAEIPALFVTLITALSVTLVGAILVGPLGGWHTPSLSSVVLLTLAAVMTLIGYQCAVLALRFGDLAAVAPVRYSQMLYAMLAGYLLFGEVPDWAMVLGAGIIVASGIYAFHRERVRDRLLAVNTSSVPPEGV